MSGLGLTHACFSPRSLIRAEQLLILNPPSLESLPSVYFPVGKVRALPKSDSSADLFPLVRVVVTFSWCSSVRILLPGLVRLQQLHSSAIAEPAHPSRNDTAPLVEWGNSTCSHWKTALSQVLEEEKSTSGSTRRCANRERRMSSSGGIRHCRDGCGFILRLLV